MSPDDEDTFKHNLQINSKILLDNKKYLDKKGSKEEINNLKDLKISI